MSSSQSVIPTVTGYKQTKIDKTVTNSAIAEAELRWIDTSNLFPVVFNDLEISRKYQLGAGKAHYSKNFGLGPHFKIILLANVRNSDIYIPSFNEVLNQLRFWNLMFFCGI